MVIYSRFILPMQCNNRRKKAREKHFLLTVLIVYYRLNTEYVQRVESRSMINSSWRYRAGIGMQDVFDAAFASCSWTDSHPAL